MPKINNSLLKSIGYFLIGKVFNLTEKPIRLGNIADPVESLEAANLQTVLSQTNHVTNTIHTIDANALYTALLADPFNIEDWKSSFQYSISVNAALKGIYESNGDFTTENSYSNLLGIGTLETDFKETMFGSTLFRPTDGTNLEGSEFAINIKIGGFDNIEITYNYEEDSTATGVAPKHLHDFRMTINGTQVLGYVMIYADDSEYHSFIIDSTSN